MNNIRNIGVIGEGKMGTSLFLFLNGFDFNLTWLCSGEPGKANARKIFNKKTGHLYQSGVITETEYSLKLSNTNITIDAGDLKHCNLVIEAITESLPDKRKLFILLDSIVNQDCILVSNSSSLAPSELILSESRKERFAGLHFFFPVTMKKTVELISGTSTSAATRKSLHNFLLHINKLPFNQDESNPFILNRILLDFQAEAFWIISENELSVAALDEIVKQSIFPMGVFEFFDHVGIDIMLSSIESYMKYSPNREFYLPALKKLREMTELNQLGIKTGKGFYDYSGLKRTSGLTVESLAVPEQLREKVLTRLGDHYMRSVISVLESGACSREDLSCYLKDYLGIDSDPFVPW